ncbi:MAG: SHOCT domain-containing protein [Deinococcales bacterium]
MEYAMAHAYGYGGFGLGFLNFLGTIIFFILIFKLIQMFAYKWRSSSPDGSSWSYGRGCHSHSRHHRYDKYRHWRDGTESSTAVDDALMVARERLAKGELDAATFESTKETLKVEAGTTFDKAMNIARLRFAKGEISREEFEAVKKTLAS